VILVGIDSMVPIYAGHAPTARRAQASESRELTRRARILLKQLHREKATVLLPTVAIAEILYPFAPDKRGALLDELQKHFVCCEFGLHACALAADVWARFR
jgi:hypothetical protein